jgi:hypothetical protein
LNAIKFLGNAVSILGAGLSGYEAVYAETAQQRALARQDLAFASFGVVFSEAAPFVTLPYAAGRVVAELLEAVEASKPSILDQAEGSSSCQ